MQIPLRILSMGWGVQTWTLAAMMALDEHPRADFLVFADTHHEGQETYAFAKEWTPWLREHGLTVVMVESGRTEVVREDWSASVLIPAFSLHEPYWEDIPEHWDDLDNVMVEASRVWHDGRGQVRRQCTHDWKIMPIRRWIRQELARRGQKAVPGAVESWMGISWDEAQRMRTSDVAYSTNTYPLVDLRMTRKDCITWLESHGLPVPPKSACTFCPFKSIAAWKELKRQGGANWQEAVDVDTNIRNKRILGAGKPGHEIQKDITLYVHPLRKPLPQAVAIPEDEGAHQLSMDIGCEGGYCMT